MWMVQMFLSVPSGQMQSIGMGTLQLLKPIFVHFSTAFSTSISLVLNSCMKSIQKLKMSLLFMAGLVAKRPRRRHLECKRKLSNLMLWVLI